MEQNNNHNGEEQTRITDTTKTEEPEVFVMPDEKEEVNKEPNAFDLLNLSNVDLFTDVEENLDTLPQDQQLKVYTKIVSNNTCMPSYDPADIEKFIDDDEIASGFGKKSELTSSIFSLGVANSDMDAVFSNGTTENYFNHTMFNNIKFYGDTIKAVSKGKNSSGFMDMLNETSGMSLPLIIPLWNSGIWIGIRNPDETQIIALKYFAAEKEKMIGATTGSTVYSNQSVLYMKTAIDLLLNLISFSNVNVPANELKDLIVASDINPALNGLAQSMFVDGVDFYRTCSNFVSKNKPCGHSFKAKIRLQNALHTDFSKMSEAQLYHMAKKSPNSVTKEEVLAYQEEFSNIFKRTKEYSLGADVKTIIEYKTPYISEYLDQGEYWVNKLTKTAALTMSKLDKKDDFRKTGYSTQMKTDLLGSYIHYFGSIKLVKGENVQATKDLKEVSAAVENFSKNTMLYDKILNDILEVIRNGTISIVGIPEYECEICKKMNTDTLPEEVHSFKKIIPFNVLQILFTLGDLRYQAIEERG